MTMTPIELFVAVTRVTEAPAIRWWWRPAA